MHADKNRLNELSGNVIGGAFIVLDTLGVGFSVKAHKSALAHALPKRGLAVAQRRRATVTHDGAMVAQYFVGLPVESALLVGLKAVQALDDAHRAQCANHPRATGLPLSLLLTFCEPRPTTRRVVNRL